jgi:hypothetical protein
MADLGAVGLKREAQRYRIGLSVWANGTHAGIDVVAAADAARAYASNATVSYYRGPFNGPAYGTFTGEDGVLSGTVTESTVPVPNARVLLLWRPLGLLIGSKRTDSNGQFSFNRLDKASAQYAVMALDPDGGILYNAIVFDRLTPV